MYGVFRPYSGWMRRMSCKLSVFPGRKRLVPVFPGSGFRVTSDITSPFWDYGPSAGSLCAYPFGKTTKCGNTWMISGLSRTRWYGNSLQFSYRRLFGAMNVSLCRMRTWGVRRYGISRSLKSAWGWRGEWRKAPERNADGHTLMHRDSWRSRPLAEYVGLMKEVVAV